MIRKTLIIILMIFPGFTPDLFSQHLSHQVLLPAAGVKLVPGINYSQTIGETAVTIFSSSGYVLTQGFQQPRITFVPVIQPPGNGVDVFPNPATYNLVVRLFGDVSRDFRIEIMTITGTIILSDEISFSGTYYHEEVFPVEYLKNGLYFVRITSMDKVINRTFKIEKL